jgi:DNA-binding NarL/FixJ family response regulator
MNQPIRVLLVDDHTENRAALREAVDCQQDMLVVAEAGTCAGAVAKVQEATPDVLVLDLQLTDGHGWVVLERLSAAGKLPHTLVLSVCEESVFARRLLAAGARGYLMKDSPLPRIVQAIRDVHRGLLVASEQVSSQLMAEAVGRPAKQRLEDEDDDRSLGLLSARELQICAMLGAGLSNKEIAYSLEGSVKTVATYKLRIMEKLGVTSTPELVARYRALGLSDT